MRTNDRFAIDIPFEKIIRMGMTIQGIPLVFRLIVCALIPGFNSSSIAADPKVTNVRAAQQPGTKLVEVFYDINGSTSPVQVGLQVSSDGGTTYAVPATALGGDVGENVLLGRNKRIVWNAGVNWNNQLSNTVKLRVIASDTPPILPPGTMVFVPSGNFRMGDAFTEGTIDELPIHSVYVSGFHLQNTEVSEEQWNLVRAWGLSHGYTDLPAGNGSYASKGPSYPVHSISWHACVKWCNARSEMEGLNPCYAVSGAIYRTGDLGPDCNWNANGYRLPTEAEWEKAARGDLSGNRFPWGDTIKHSLANFISSTNFAYDVSPTRGYHPTWATGSHPWTASVASFAPNRFGIYEMAGNLSEWCWDWSSGNYYSISPASNPRGPISGGSRVVRGGRWNYDANNSRVAHRDYGSGSGSDVGFRPARSSVP